VLPEHVANAALTVTVGEISHTFGLHIRVGTAVAAAFLR
jgi:hypothetical protein